MVRAIFDGNRETTLRAPRHEHTEHQRDCRRQDQSQLGFERVRVACAGRDWLSVRRSSPASVKLVSEAFCV